MMATMPEQELEFVDYSIEPRQIHYLVEGQGPPVILIHGLAASCYDWAALLPALASAGYRAYAPDLLGHGESPKPASTDCYQAERVYQSLVAWIDSLGLDQPPVLIGHSLGGYLSLQYEIRRHGPLAGLILIDPLYSPDQLSPLLRWINQRPHWGETAMRLVPEWLLNAVLGLDPTNGNDFSELARQQIANDYKRASARIVYIPATIEDLTPYLSHVKALSLLLWGNRDLTLATSSFPKLHQAIPENRARMIPDSGHQPHIGKPELVNKLVLSFLQDLKRPASALARKFSMS
jgi:pimeloyl-ACP methyl ester carboxylesterase